MRRTRLMGAAAVAASSLAFAGIGGPAIAGAKTKAKSGSTKSSSKHKKKKSKPKPTTTSTTCKMLLSVAVPAGDTTITPPLTKGTMNGTAKCGGVGSGLAQLTFTLNQGSGENTGAMTLLTGTGGLTGTFTLAQSGLQPPPTAYTFGNANYSGNITLKGGSGDLAKAKGKGSLACDTLDSVHFSCTAKLKITLPAAS